MTFGVTSSSSEPDHLCIAEYSVLDLRNKVIEDKVMFVNPRSEYLACLCVAQTEHAKSIL